MHGMLASMAEFYSKNLAAEAKKGLHQKAMAGRTPGYAPVGYLNVIRRVDGYEFRTNRTRPRPGRPRPLGLPRLTPAASTPSPEVPPFLRTCTVGCVTLERRDDAPQRSRRGSGSGRWSWRGSGPSRSPRSVLIWVSRSRVCAGAWPRPMLTRGNGARVLGVPRWSFAGGRSTSASSPNFGSSTAPPADRSSQHRSPRSSMATSRPGSR